MALVKCPECGKEISNKAEVCPNCGYPISRDNTDTEKGKEENTNSQEGEKTLENIEIQQDNLETTEKKSKKKISKKGIIIASICVVALLTVAIMYFVMTADSRNYKSAQELYKNEQFEEALQKFTELGTYEDSAKMVEKCNYELSVDGQFMRELSKGLMKRWDKSDEYAEQGSVGEDPNIYSEYCDIELEELEKYYDQTFDNQELQEDAKTYIDYLRAAKDATKHYTIDYNTYNTMWADIYAKRTMLLNTFVEKYGLSVDEKHQKTLDDILVDASAAKEQVDFKNAVAKMTESFKISTTEDEWGYKTYKVSMKNTTNHTFEYFYADVSVLDQSGKIIASGSLDQISSWKPEQEATVDAYFDSNVSLDGYTLEYTPHYQSGSYFE